MVCSSDLVMTKQAHVISEGRVYCANDGREVDVERCVMCPLLEDIDLDSRRPKVVCRLSPAAESRNTATA
jgi:hypothetical protein